MLLWRLLVKETSDLACAPLLLHESAGTCRGDKGHSDVEFPRNTVVLPRDGPRPKIANLP
jgi:hypothetical protein